MLTKPKLSIVFDALAIWMPIQACCKEVILKLLLCIFYFQKLPLGLLQCRFISQTMMQPQTALACVQE
eukprot:s472_g24.t1